MYLRGSREPLVTAGDWGQSDPGKESDSSTLPPVSELGHGDTCTANACQAHAELYKYSLSSCVLPLASRAKRVGEGGEGWGICLHADHSG